MSFSSNLFDIIVLLGAVQGFISGFALLFGKSKTHSNNLLACLTLLIALACLNIFLLETGIQSSSTTWMIVSAIVPLIIIMPIGPLVYYYTLALTQPNFRITKNQHKHFYPIIFDLVPSLAAIIYLLGVLFGFINASSQSRWGNFIDAYNMYVDIPRWISVSLYIALAWQNLRAGNFRNISSGTLIWIRQFIIVFTLFQVIWLLHLIPYLIPGVSDHLLDSVSWYPVYIPLAILVYWLGINGYLKRSGESKSPLKPIEKETVLYVMNALTKAMEQDKLFLNPVLSLKTLAEHTVLTPKIISAVLNQYAGKGFNEFVNEYRIEEVKKLLLNPSKLTITGIAFECGFNSQATFQRTFKQFTGLSPKEFQQQGTANLEKSNAQIRN